MIKQPRIIVDMDDCLNKFSDILVYIYNVRYNDNKTSEDIKGWDMENYLTNCTKEELYAIMDEPNFFRNIKRMPRSPFVLEKLRREYNCDITVLSAYHKASILADKEYWLEAFMNIGREDTIFGEKKKLIKGDVMIDDKPSNLEEFEGLRVLYDQPHNRWATEEDIGPHVRVKDWWEIEELLVGENGYLVKK